MAASVSSDNAPSSTVPAQNVSPPARGTTALHGFSAPSKGYFATSSLSGSKDKGSTGAISAQTPSSNLRSPVLSTNDLPPASSPSSVPAKGRRRESIGTQYRRNVSGSTTVAAAGGGIGSTLLRSQQQQSQQQQPIPVSRGMASSDASAFSTSFGAAAASFGAAGEALSSSVSTARSLATSVKAERGTGHTHFGQECFGPRAGDTLTQAPPSKSMLSSSARRGSFSSTVAGDDDSASSTAGDGKQTLHKCETCAKVYRHPSCLIKHRWEHTVYWKEASKFLMSKHQQVQLLEAAAILVGMDCNARSLPEEKALWPAAVSPPESGLLGSDKLNLSKLLAAKTSRKSQTPTPSTGPEPASVPARGYSALRSPSSGLSPLNALTALNLGTSLGTSSSYRQNGDVQHLHLDESAERTERSGSADTEEQDLDADSPPTSHDQDGDDKEERWGLDAGGDVMAEMEMDE